jgi:histidine triad (HIT) family protein
MSLQEPDAAPSCPFCRIALGTLPAVILYEDSDVVAFLDRGPIRPGHAQIIPRAHFATFEILPLPLLTKIAALAQQLATRMKHVYSIERVAFLFTGGDVAHVHAHVVPMIEKTDITSARYIVSPTTVVWSSDHLLADPTALLATRDLLAFRPDPLP